MKLTIEHKKGLTILKLQEKRLDAAIAPHLKSKLVILIEGEGEKYLVIDISQVQAIDSSGIGALLLAHRNTLAHDGFAAIVGVNEQVYDLLKMTQLDKQLYIFDSIRDVLNNLETVETDDEDADEDEPEKTSKSSKPAPAVDLDESENLLDEIPELDEETLDELNLDLEEIEDLELSAEDEPKQKEKKKKTKRSTTKTKSTTKSRKNTESKTKKAGSTKSATAKAKSKKKSKA
jgi:anti-anti-sigma factor